jgi:hypothetical protein
LLGDTDDGVRGSAIWALGRLSPAQFGEMKARFALAEESPEVRMEWDSGAEGNTASAPFA